MSEHGDASLDEALAGWGAPEPAAGFADGVLEALEPPAAAAARPARRRRGWALVFTLGATAGAVAAAATLKRPRGVEPGVEVAPQQPTLVHVPGVLEAVGRPGSRFRWRTGSDGRVVVDQRAGVVLYRVGPAPSGVLIRAGGEAVDLRGPCGMVEVQRRLLNTDTNVEQVSCEAIESAIAEAKTELWQHRSR